MSASTRTPRYRGVFPVAPTTFSESGELDLASQRRCVDFMIDAGSHGLCILANFSEQFVLGDDERERLTRSILEHVAGRVPVIVTTTHFSTRLCIERSRRAQALGAAMVMVMPPYHGATIRVPEAQSFEFFARLSDALGIPIMIQDAPVSGTVLSAPLLARMAREIEQVAYFKIETAGAASKLRELIRRGGDAIEGPWDGEEGITLLPDFDAGATGAMTGGAYADGIRTIVDAHVAGRRDEASAYLGKIRERVPEYRIADFLAAFRCSEDAEAIFTTNEQSPPTKAKGLEVVSTGTVLTVSKLSTTPAAKFGSVSPALVNFSSTRQ